MTKLRPRDVVRIRPDTTECPGPGDIGIVERAWSARLCTDADTVRWLVSEACERMGHLSLGEPYSSSAGERLVGVFYERNGDGAQYRFEVGRQPEMSLGGRMEERSRANVLQDALYQIVGDGCIEAVR